MSPLEKAIQNLLLEMKLTELTWAIPQRFYINCTEEEARNDPFMERRYIY